jgi:Rrf2 family protein
VPRAYLAHILTMLVDAGVVSSQAGPTGGYSLADPPEHVSLLTVLAAVEGPLQPTECVLRDGSCGADGTHCAVHETWFRGHEALREHLAGTSLASVAGRAHSA